MNEGVESAVKTAITFEQLGIVGVLFLVIVWLGFLYWKERQKTEKLTERLFSELAENSKEMTAALMGVEQTVGGFKTTLESLKMYLCNPPRREP